MNLVILSFKLWNLSRALFLTVEGGLVAVPLQSE